MLRVNVLQVPVMRGTNQVGAKRWQRQGGIACLSQSGPGYATWMASCVRISLATDMTKKKTNLREGLPGASLE